MGTAIEVWTVWSGNTAGVEDKLNQVKEILERKRHLNRILMNKQMLSVWETPKAGRTWPMGKSIIDLNHSGLLSLNVSKVYRGWKWQVINLQRLSVSNLKRTLLEWKMSVLLQYQDMCWIPYTCSFDLKGTSLCIKFL